MKKFSRVVIASIFMINAIHALSISEYIEKFGPVEIHDGVINLANKDLTNLNGIELITKEPETIKEINLSHNKLINLNTEQISMFPHLEILIINNNQLTSFPALSSSTLKKLNIKKNNIEVLSDLNFPELIKLKASNNPIHTLSNLNFPKLKKLKMLGSKLSKVSNVNFPAGTKIKVGAPGKELFIEMERTQEIK